MALSVLDISKALSDHVVTWLPPSPLPPGSEVPQECILYSLVRGRTELIMFGGLMKDISLGGQLRDLSQENKPMNDIVVLYLNNCCWVSVFTCWSQSELPWSHLCYLRKFSLSIFTSVRLTSNWRFCFCTYLLGRSLLTCILECWLQGTPGRSKVGVSYLRSSWGYYCSILSYSALNLFTFHSLFSV